MDKNNSNRNASKIADWSFNTNSTTPSNGVSSSNEYSASNETTISSQGGESKIGQGSVIRGELSFLSATTIEGSVEGSIACSDEIVIAEQGCVDASITAKYVKVFGRVNGDISSEILIELFAGSQVKGNISSPRVVMHDGVLFEGNCKMEAASLLVEPSISLEKETLSEEPSVFEKISY